MFIYNVTRPVLAPVPCACHDCCVAQVKCRDRKGLLLDIIRALRLLPLEVRTAAVTTQADGCVRDVFEVRRAGKRDCVCEGWGGGYMCR
jgi:UTP:GlnB (protein PII) uridylyltransferase